MPPTNPFTLFTNNSNYGSTSISLESLLSEEKKTSEKNWDLWSLLQEDSDEEDESESLTKPADSKSEEKVSIELSYTTPSSESKLSTQPSALPIEKSTNQFSSALLNETNETNETNNTLEDDYVSPNICTHKFPANNKKGKLLDLGKQHVNNFVNWWTLLSSILLINDIIRYSSEEHHYTANLSDLLLGVHIPIFGAFPQFNSRTSEKLLLNNLGSDLVTENLYWLGFSLTLGLPIFRELTSFIYQITCSPNNWRGLLDQYPNNDKNFNFIKKLMYTIFIGYPKLENLDRAYAAIKYEGYKRLYVLPDLSIKIYGNAYQKTSLTSIRATEILYEMSSKDYPNLFLYPHHIDESVLKNISKFNRAYFSYLKKPWLKRIALAFREYLMLRLLILISQKIGGLENYLSKKSNCEAKNNNIRFFKETGDYTCTPCGDIKKLTLEAQINAQLCLNELINLLTNQKIPEELNRFSLINDIEYINLSYLSLWEYDSLLLNQFFKIFYTKLFNFIDLSQISVSEQELSINQTQAIVNFLQQTRANKISLNRQQFYEDALETLINASSQIKCDELELNEIALGERGAFLLGKTLPSYQNIKRLRLNDNQITDLGFSSIAYGIINSSSTLTGLDCDNNDLANLALEDLSQINNLKALSIAGLTNYEASYLKEWAESLTHTNYRVLGLNNFNIDTKSLDVFAPYLKNSPIKALSFSQNNLSNDNANIFFENLSTENLLCLIIKNTRIDSNALPTLTSFLRKSNIQTLVMENNEFDITSWKNFTSEILKSNIKILQMRACNINDEMAEVFGNTLINTSNKITTIDFSNNQITSLGAGKLFAASASVGIINLNLSNNYLDTVFLLTFSKTVKNGKFKTIDLSYNQGLESSDIAEAYKSLKESSVEVFLAQGITLERKDLCTISLNLGDTGHDLSFICENNNSLDQARSLQLLKPSNNLKQISLTSNANKDLESLNKILLHLPINTAPTFSWEIDPNQYLNADNTTSYEFTRNFTRNTVREPDSIPYTNVIATTLFIIWLINLIRACLPSSLTKKSIFAKKPNLSLSINDPHVQTTSIKINK